MILGIKDKTVVAVQKKGIIPGMDETQEVDSFSFDWIGFPLTNFDWTDSKNPRPTEAVVEREREMKSADEENKRRKIEEDIRTKRNELLRISDWTQVPDSPSDKEAWANYRQALRDIPQQEGFPHDVVWPVVPE
ncbi:tail fiber assembly protein [Marispirochaeta aestuarii]|uniref:tail fiber assembly protein n=1 Tax=Marispirochaeta aestuarii TaxID=1963862 RepID=UPI002ABD3537|nr:tail fiber assembly protein [Marispirochaeta aestuarii]